ncbi:MAG: efflux RND transporter periplasmic adaptor subunit [Helicobacteraceae bacterium]|jgi:HlyD family secretion protein|nr:efflux RND transporter periplasmic adaptor subunit [Helicobacteraceae bacterium]
MYEIDLDKLNRKSSKWRAVIFAIAILAIAAAAIWLIFFREVEKEIKFTTAPLTKRDLKVTVQATGNLEPLRTVTVGIEVSGTLEDVLADFNDEVKVGQVLARLDATKLESSLSSAKAHLKVAEANVRSGAIAENEAKLQLNRLAKIYESTKGDYPSEKDMESAKATYDRAVASLAASRAQLEQAKADVDASEENLRKAVVISPINGTILTRSVDPGQTVAATMQTPTLFTIAEDLSKMQVVVAVDEADVGEVKAGQRVTFFVNAYPNREFAGEVKQVRLGSQITSGVVTYNTVVLVDNNESLLRPGMTAQASIITKQVDGALTAPNAAFRFTPPPPKADGMAMFNMSRPKEERGARLFVLANGAPKRVAVERGESDGAYSAVRSAELKEGDQIIIGVQNAQ